ncbi:non-ribosomal peptide synthetase, partial [Acrocarpospora catenulata]|uniref:non-ribosomal peptide synthetase n=1 Tax=Acrocarpospora catenulata TaxID=2836182 RepID=UPI001BD9B042
MGDPRQSIALRELVARECGEPFDLEHGPVLRARLFRLAEDDHVLLLVLHHIACDGWSMPILWHELATLYQGGELPDLPLQYADHAHHQRITTTDTGLDYWLGQLAEVETLNLPTDRPRSGAPGRPAEHVPLSVPADAAAALGTLAAESGTTQHVVLVTALQVLLSRLTGQTDITVGTPAAGRDHPDTAGLIGFFVNTLVLRADLTDNPTFRHLLQQTRTTTLDALAHQHTPFERVVEHLNPIRTPGQTPLFSVLFTGDGDASAALAWPGGVQAEPYPCASGGALFDLTFSLREEPGGLAGTLEYDAELFDLATAERIADHLTGLLRQVADRPDLPVSDYELSIPAESRQLARWNATRLTYPTKVSVEEYFEAHADAAPDDLALVCEDERLTYGQVERRANRLAHLIRELGAGVEDVVAVCVARGPDSVIAPLAALKAGAAFFPVDADQPAARLAAMFAGARPAVVLAHTALVPQIPPGPWRVACVDGEVDQPEERPARAVPGAALAYVIHTSGSTGAPKGVMVTRNGLANLRADWAARKYHERRWLTVASPSFDVFIGDVVRSLTFGGSLVIGSRTLALSPGELADALERERTDAFDSIPAVLHSLSRHLASTGRTLPDLRLLVSGGDAFPVADGEAILATFGPRVRVLNAWGATETTIDSTIHELRAGRRTVSGVVPVGGPAANTAVHVLDERGGPVPIGVVGELYVGGEGVARGYVGQPALTAAAFVPDPAGREPGARLYRTGDRGRWLPDGTIEFLGRDDDQVKIRGHRVEPGEVQAVLREHPDVADCYVLAVPDGPGNHRLVGYVVPARPSDPGVLRDHCNERLPRHMWLSGIVEIDALPRTPSGKVDRARLPGAGAAVLSRAAHEPPRTELERAVAAAWRRVLETPAEIGAHDDFFDLGGHSMLATRLLFALRQDLGVDLPITAVFEAPTVAAMASRVAAARLSSAPIEPAPREVYLPLSFAQERLWFLWKVSPGSPAYNMPVSVRLRGPLDVAALSAALTGVVARHEVLRTRYAEMDGTPVQVVDDPAPVALPVTTPGDLDEALHQEWSAPFDLEHGPLLRARLFRVADDDHVLLLVVHHIACDGWSMPILWDELATLYQGGELPGLPLQYADYAHHQRVSTTDTGLDYWVGQLAEVETLDLPTDRPRPNAPSQRGGHVTFELPAVGALSRDNDATVYMVLLAALQVLLSRLTGQTDITVGTPAAGRDHPDTAGLIGFFVNTLVLRADLSDNPTFRHLLQRTRTTTLDALAHQHTPFERVVEHLNPVRTPGRTPLFSVLFTYSKEESRDSWSLDGLELTRQDVDVPAAQFDLTFAVHESEQGLHGALYYSTDLFDRATAKSMAGRLVRLLGAAVAEPGTPVGHLPVLSPEEAEHHRGPRRASAPALLPAVFEEYAERTPYAPAVIADGEMWTYGQLNRLANQIAHQLRARGAGPETVIALGLPRSVRMIAAILGVHKAGAAYLPLDLEHPDDRLAYTLQDADPLLVLTDGDSRLPGAVNLADLLHGPDHNPGIPPLPEHAAYVIYTSGSTGRPKGVVLEHRGLANLTANLGERLDRLGGGMHRVLQLVSPGFDVMVSELVTAFTRGGCLVVAPATLTGDALGAFLRKHRVTLAHMPPAVLATVPRVPLPDLRVLVVGGESSPPELLAHWAAGRAVINAYGPSEVTVDATEWRYEDGARIVIGHPVGDVEVLLLDGNLQPVPPHTPGELYIAGPGVGRGYLNRPTLTAQRFIPHPHHPGARMYRTGDQARRHPNGTLEFIGRTDNQIKLRGHRIELAEIENTLTQAPGVTQATITLHNNQLIAYLTPQTADPTTTHQHALTHLPTRERVEEYIRLRNDIELQVGRINGEYGLFGRA